MSKPTVIEPGDEILPSKPPTVVRHTKAARVNHWISAAAMILLIVSGLGMFHPSLFFLTSLFGGGQVARTLHPVFGVVLTASFFLMFLRYWRGNLPKREDAVWLLHIGDLVAGHHEKMPEIGKYNAGQKGVFWGLGLLILTLLVTGVTVWDQFFSGLAPIPVQRVALILHAVAAVCAILIVVTHVYAAIWIRGSFDAMVKGYVTAGWAMRHHPKWLRRLAEKSRQDGTTKKSA